MGISSVVIKFISPDHAGNVITSLAVEPEILIPVGYGEVLSDELRGRYNHFFHLRGIPTVVTQPVSFEKNLPADVEGKLERLLAKYESRSPVVDIADADSRETMALGSVLANHRYWGAAVLDYDQRRSLFIPVQNASHLKRLRFPLLGEADYRFLRGEMSAGTTDADTYASESVELTRKQLNHETAERIRSLGRLYAEAPAFWRESAAKIRKEAGEFRGEKTEFILDAASVGVRDTVYEDLREIGILSSFERKAGVIRLRFAGMTAMQLFFHIDRILCANIFLITAQVREYGKNAAFRDLTMHDFRYVTGFYRCLPTVLAVYDETRGAEQFPMFELLAYRLYGENARKVLVRYGRSALDKEIRTVADHYDVELVPVRGLKEALEPK